MPLIKSLWAAAALRLRPPPAWLLPLIEGAAGMLTGAGGATGGRGGSGSGGGGGSRPHTTSGGVNIFEEEERWQRRLEPLELLYLARCSEMLLQVWHGMAWYVMISPAAPRCCCRYGMVWHGMAWYGMQGLRDSIAGMAWCITSL